ncbi:Chitinase-3-like protein 1 [Frankliniella fusca]|uniref:Chitinase-3-like protein 1 n=1 Tax=Frankliniella fusca TaxID=407009 RepID=A0AAE1LNL2_9NEOP|nr:Chitinase-3-like protein 1 [Frankliniella fusca]
MRAFTLLALLAVLGTVVLVDLAEAQRARGLDRRTLLCYAAAWHAKYKPRDVNSDLCSMIMVAFGRLVVSQTGALEEAYPMSDDDNKVSVGGVVHELQRRNSSTAVGLTIGGWAEGSERFSVVSADPQKRKVFVNSVVKAVKRWNLKGVELAWVAPGTRGGQKTDGANYVQLVAVSKRRGGLRPSRRVGRAPITALLHPVTQDVSRALVPLGVYVGVALPVTNGDDFFAAFHLADLAEHVDWFLLQGYDLHGHWDPFTDVNSPLYSAAPNDNQTLSWRLGEFLRRAPRPELFVLSMPAFGRTWTLADSPVPGALGARSELGVMFGDGMLAYNEICTYLNADEDDERKLITSRDPVSKTPYAVSNRPTRRGFVSYDDPQSIREKVDFALASGLPGVALFTIDNDDYLGTCGAKYPLLKAAREALDRD